MQHRYVKKYSDSTACSMNLDVVVGVALLARQLHYRLRFDLQGRTAVRQQQYNPGKKVVQFLGAGSFKNIGDKNDR
jgi:hypothetical protein